MLRILLCFVLAASAVSAEPVILLVGDSTVAAQATSPGAGPNRGWGQLLPEFFNPGVTIRNAASNGRSSKSFIDEGKWQEALSIKPNYVFILWGTNDQNANPARHTDAATTFRDCLRRYIDDSVAAGSVPVLITPSAMRMFDSNGLIKNALAPYADAMKAVAEERKVPLIDLNAATVMLYEKLGPDDSMKLAAKPEDKTHFNEDGARLMARIIAEALPAAVPALVPDLVKPASAK